MTEAFYTLTRWEILQPEVWEGINEEKKRVLRRVFDSYVQAYGRPFVVNYGDSDLRILWAKEIKVDRLKQDVRSPIGTSYDCPLCQPYDAWDGFSQANKERRFQCKVIDPKYGEMERGTWMRCPCLKNTPSS